MLVFLAVCKQSRDIRSSARSTRDGFGYRGRLRSRTLPFWPPHAARHSNSLPPEVCLSPPWLGGNQSSWTKPHGADPLPVPEAALSPNKTRRHRHPRPQTRNIALTWGLSMAWALGRDGVMYIPRSLYLRFRRNQVWRGARPKWPRMTALQIAKFPRDREREVILIQPTSVPMLPVQRPRGRSTLGCLTSAAICVPHAANRLLTAAPQPVDCMYDRFGTPSRIKVPALYYGPLPSQVTRMRPSAPFSYRL